MDEGPSPSLMLRPREPRELAFSEVDLPREGILRTRAVCTLVLLASVCLAIAGLAGSAAAQEPTTQPQTPAQDYEGRTVRDIVFIGSPNSSPDVLRSKIKTAIGKPYKADVLDEDLRYLVEKVKLFQQVDARVIPDGDGAKIELIVTENPRIVAILFLGILEYDRAELLEVMESREGGLADDITLRLDEKKIREKYLKEGFHFVQVRHERRLEEFGTSIIFTITEGEDVSLEEVRFIGNRSFDPDDLLEAMPKTDTGNFLFGHTFVEKELNEDLVQLQQFYRGNGFLDATATLTDTTFSPDKEEVYVTITIDEGEPYIIRSLEIRGMTRFDVQQTKAEMQSQIGGRYEMYFKLTKDRTEILKKYHEEAYINARCDDRSIIDDKKKEVDVVFEIVEGEPCKVGNVIIEGNTETKDKVIRRALEELGPGSPLNLNMMNRARQRLLQLNYFARESLQVIKPNIGFDDFEVYRNAYLSVEDTERENVKDIRVNVEETDTGSLQFAVGVGSNVGLVGSIIYRKENFDPTDWPESFDDVLDAFTGGGQRLILQVAPGTQQSQFSGSYFHPNVFDSEYQYSHSIFHRIYFRENWDEQRTGTTIGVGRRFGYNISASLNYRLELVTVDDIDEDAGQIVFDFEGERLISSLGPNLTIADLEIDEQSLQPVEGYRIRPGYEYAGLGGDIEFHKVTVGTEYYLTVLTDADDRKHVLYFDGNLGYVVESGDSHDVPIYERFFAGGHGSIRGFEYRGVGPHTNDSPDGGKVLLTGSLNYEFPIFQNILRGVVFLDAGTLANDWGDEEMGNIRLSTGFGVRLQIPFLGPVPFALDFGIPILKYDEDETRLISFSIERKF